MNRNYAAGRRLEYEVMAKRRDFGFTVMRTAGSHGPFDVIVIGKSGQVEMIQCKVTESPAVAARLIEQFKKHPPFKPLVATFLQTMYVKIKGGEFVSVTV